MKSELLHVVTAIANPSRWSSRINLYKKFEQHMLDSGVHLTTVECAYGDRPHVLDNPHVNHVKVRASGENMVWNKESLLNIGISRMPDAQYIMTSDADIEFRKSGWAAETVHALQHFHVVQPWSHAYDLGPNDDHLQTHTSFCKLFYDKKTIQPKWSPDYTYAHTGYAWAWTRQALSWLGGLVDFAALGAADHHMSYALLGRADESLPGKIHPNYRQALKAWETRAVRHINKSLGYVPGTIEHGWHGSKENRKYVERWSIILKHQFDPYVDLKRNLHGVVELAGNKPDLRHDVHLYFNQRNEDSNTLG
jgi:hypothetical protein